MLALHGIHHRYGRHAALVGVDLHLAPGTCYGFLGHNGAGKTTLIRCALGLVRPQRGTIAVDGVDALRHPRAALARLGGTVETPSFHPDRTALDDLRLLCGLQGIGRRAARVEAGRVLDAVGLAAHARRRTGTFSLGMRQRLGIAQALLGDRPYLLLDEPFSNLDPEGIAELRALLRHLATDRQRALLVSSHQLHELEGLCTHVGILRQGRMLVEDELASLLRRGDDEPYQLRATDPTAALAALRELGLEAAADGAEGAIEVQPGGFAAADLARALVQRGIGLTAFAPRPRTLESVYLRLPDAAPAPVENPAPTPRPPGRDTVTWPRAAARSMGYELSRLRRPRYLLLALFPVAVAALAVERRVAAARADAELVRTGELFSATAGTAWDAIGAAAGQAVIALLVLAAVLGSQTIAGERGRGTLTLVVTRPLGRGSCLSGKSAALAAVLAGSWLGAMVAAFALAALLLPFTAPSELLAGGELAPLIDVEAVRSRLLPALLGTLPPLAAYLAIGVAVSCLARRGTTALAFALAAVAGLELARGVAGEAWLPSAHLPSLLRDTSELRAFTDLALGRADAYAPFAGWRVPSSLAWIAAAMAIATVAFRRTRLT